PALTIAGKDTANYTLIQPTGLKASITGKELTVPNALALSRIYDGTKVAAISGTLTGIVGKDDVRLADTTGLFAQTGIGTDIAVTPALTIAGNDAANYSLTQPSGLKASITPKELTVTNAAAQSKIYDGKTTAKILGSLTGIIGTENVTIADSIGAFAQSGIGTDISVTPALTIAGSDKANYTLTQPSGLKASITPKGLTVPNAAAQSKIYDGKTTAKIKGTLTGIIGEENVVLADSTGIFAQTATGTTIAVTPALTIAGKDTANYTLIQPTGLKASITGKELTVPNALALSKIYDGTKVAAISGTLIGIVGKDDVRLADTTGIFAQTGIGTDIAVTPALTIAGNDAANYSLTQPSGLKAKITPKELTVANAAAQSKTYDGTTKAKISGATLKGIVGSENVILTNDTIGTFAQSGIGTDIPVASAMELSGNDIANYTLTQPGYLIASITTLQVAVTEPTVIPDKVYDGNPQADVMAGFLKNITPEDSGKVFITAIAVYSDSTAGTDKTITISYVLSGPAAGNYAAPPSVTYLVKAAAIKPKQLTITAPTLIMNKMIDGTTAAEITDIGQLLGVERVDTDKVTVSATANYDTAAVGINKKITVSYTLSGAASANYIAPIDTVLTGAKISDYIALSPVEITTAGCEGHNLEVPYKILTGTPTQFKLTFDDEAQKAGIENMAFTELPTTDSTGILPILVPEGTPDGTYIGSLQLQNELGVASPEYPFQFVVNLSTDYIVVKFIDVILCDNSSERFASYQWYKDGVEIKGATKQFYCDPSGYLVGSYSLKVITTDGKTIYSCPKVLNNKVAKSVVVSPSSLKLNQKLTVQLTGFNYKELQNAELTVYDAQGIMIYHSGKVNELNQVTLPAVPGVYIGHLSSERGINEVFKVVVEK
ncbi:MAG: YDG domain-containing protein, partial [Bacteroidota bacterium]|nr:YDG domain-containing protein [Bacteroidota bacterium]